MDFGQALDALKSGKRVARAGWNGKGMWLCYGHGIDVVADDFRNEHLIAFAKEQPDHRITILPYLIMKTADNKALFGWLASQSDMLAQDWEIV